MEHLLVQNVQQAMLALLLAEQCARQDIILKLVLHHVRSVLVDILAQQDHPLAQKFLPEAEAAAVEEHIMPAL